MVIDTESTKSKELVSKYFQSVKENGLGEEKYKWKLINQFKGRPNLNAPDFEEEFLSINFANLVYHNSLTVLKQVVKKKPEELRALLKNLSDINISLSNRVTQYLTDFEKVYRTVEPDIKFSNSQDERTIATILTYMDPANYTFFKDSFYQKFCKLTGVRPMNVGKKYEHYLDLVRAFRDDYIESAGGLMNLVREELGSELIHTDPSNLLIVQDILYKTLDRLEQKPNLSTTMSDKQQVWLFSPGEQASSWEEFYEKGIMGLGWDNIGDLNQYESFEEIQEVLQNVNPGQGKQTNDARANFEFKEAIQIGDLIIPKRGRSEFLGYGVVTSDYFYNKERLQYQKCRTVDWKKKGVWPVEEKNIVLKTLTEISKYPDYVKELKEKIGIDKVEEPTTFDHPKNQILYGPPGTGKTYNTINKALEILGENISKLSRQKIKELYDRNLSDGRIVFTTFHQSMNYEDFIEGIKPDLSDDNDGKIKYHIKDGIFKQLCMRAKNPGAQGFEKSYSDFLEKFGEDENPLILDTPKGKKFGVIPNSNGNLTLLTGTDKIKRGVLTKENLQKHIANIKTSSDWPGYYEGVISHLKTNYSYSPDYRATGNYVIIIDEINRGNVSQIFGELITLIEDDKRLGKPEAIELVLPYSNEKFGVPSNVYIIGTMNTADRSVEALDTALRRRFSFQEMPPLPELVSTAFKLHNLWWQYPKANWDEEPFLSKERNLHTFLGIQELDQSIKEQLWNKMEVEGKSWDQIKGLKSQINCELDLEVILTTLNRRIEKLIDRDHQIGHSYFIGVDSLEELKHSFKNKIIPLLQEYFFGDYHKMGLVVGEGFFDLSNLKEENIFAQFNDDNGSEYHEKTVYRLRDISKMTDNEFTQALQNIR